MFSFGEWCVSTLKVLWYFRLFSIYRGWVLVVWMCSGSYSMFGGTVLPVESINAYRGWIVVTWLHHGNLCYFRFRVFGFVKSTCDCPMKLSLSGGEKDGVCVRLTCRTLLLGVLFQSCSGVLWNCVWVRGHVWCLTGALSGSIHQLWKSHQPARQNY